MLPVLWKFLEGVKPRLLSKPGRRGGVTSVCSELSAVCLNALVFVPGPLVWQAILVIESAVPRSCAHVFVYYMVDDRTLTVFVSCSK